jgi:hypothetical protein
MLRILRVSSNTKYWGSVLGPYVGLAMTELVQTVKFAGQESPPAHRNRHQKRETCCSMKLVVPFDCAFTALHCHQSVSMSQPSPRQLLSM